MTAPLTPAESFLALLDALPSVTRPRTNTDVLLAHAAATIRGLLEEVRVLEQDAEDAAVADVIDRAFAEGMPGALDYASVVDGCCIRCQRLDPAQPCKGCYCHEDVPRPERSDMLADSEESASLGPAAPDLSRPGWPSVLLGNPAARFACGNCGSFRWSSSDGLTCACGDCGQTGPLVEVRPAAFWEDLRQNLRDPVFAAEYGRVSAEIAAADAFSDKAFMAWVGSEDVRRDGMGAQGEPATGPSQLPTLITGPGHHNGLPPVTITRHVEPAEPFPDEIHNGHALRPPEWQCTRCERRLPGRKPEDGLCARCGWQLRPVSSVRLPGLVPVVNGPGRSEVPGQEHGDEPFHLAAVIDDGDEDCFCGLPADHPAAEDGDTG